MEGQGEITTHLAYWLVFWLREEPILNIVTEGRDLFKRAFHARSLLNAEFQLASLLANAWLLVPGRSGTVAQIRVGVVAMVDLFVGKFGKRIRRIDPDQMDLLQCEGFSAERA